MTRGLSDDNVDSQGAEHLEEQMTSPLSSHSLITRIRGIDFNVLNEASEPYSPQLRYILFGSENSMSVSDYGTRCKTPPSRSLALSLPVRSSTLYLRKRASSVELHTKWLRWLDVSSSEHAI